jgi:hypothetical protein
MTAIDRAAVRAYRPLSTPGRSAATIGAGVVADVAFDPAHRHVPLCPVHALTGGWCPLCGGLRAVDSLAHGQLATALRDNALVVAAIPLLLVLWLDWAQRRPDGRPARRVPRAATIGAIAVVVAFTVVRNLAFATGLHP